MKTRSRAKTWLAICDVFYVADNSVYAAAGAHCDWLALAGQGDTAHFNVTDALAAAVGVPEAGERAYAY